MRYAAIISLLVLALVRLASALNPRPLFESSAISGSTESSQKSWEPEWAPGPHFQDTVKNIQSERFRSCMNKITYMVPANEMGRETIYEQIKDRIIKNTKKCWGRANYVVKLLQDVNRRINAHIYARIYWKREFGINRRRIVIR